MNKEESVSLIKLGAGGSRKKMHVTNHKTDNYYLDVFSYKDIESLNLPTQQVLLSNLWRTEENVMIYSKTGVGKSWLSLSIATCIAGQGKMTVCDWENEIKRKVLLVDGEMSVRDYQNRLPVLIEATKADPEKVRENLDFVPRQRQEQYEYFTNLANENNQSELINYAKSRGIDTLILDNLSTLTEFDNENNSESMKLFQKFLLRARSEGLQTLVVHHMRKGKEDDESYRGSSVLGVSLDTILRLESPDYGSPDGTVTFNIIDEKKRHSATHSWSVQLNLNTNEWQLYDEYHQDLRHDMMLDIVESKKFRTQTDISKVLCLGDTAISKYLKEMSYAKAGGHHLGRTSKDVMKKVRQTLSDVKKSSKMYPDEVVLEEARKWFHERWKITLAGEKTNKRLVDIEQLEDQNPDF
tara:strand:- start:214 stop:1446 length:1233 start_codon:yes stop_codon:yes gene_type:complete